MPNLLQNKTALVIGVANRWSIAYAVASAFRREGAQLVLTYQGERQRLTVEELGRDLGAAKIFNCDVTKTEELDRLAAELKALPPGLDIAVHSIAFANKEDLSNPFVQTSRDGFLLAQEVSAYSLVSLARTLAPLMASGGAILTLTYLGSTRVMTNYNVMGVAKASLEACVRYQDRLGASREGPWQDARSRCRPRPFAPQYRAGGSRGHGRLSRQRHGPRDHRQHHFCRRRVPYYGNVSNLLRVPNLVADAPSNFLEAPGFGRFEMGNI
jgi:NADP-dependent 3-hydroxy acid dehydrogenase YdfG